MDRRSVPVRFWASGNAADVEDEEETMDDHWGSLNVQINGVETYPGAGDGAVSISDLKLAPNELVCRSGGRNYNTVLLEPGKLYRAQISTAWVDAFELSLAAPPGYRVEIDGQVRSRKKFEELIPIPSYLMWAEIRVVPVNDFAGPAGFASPLADGRIFWQVALGGLLNGSSAGALTLVDAGTGSSWQSLFSPAGLSYAPTSDEVHVHYEDGLIRQIIAPAVVVDVVSSAQDEALGEDQFELRFYHPHHNHGSTIPRRFLAEPSEEEEEDFHPFLVYRVEKGSSATELKITREMRELSNLAVPIEPRSITSIARTGSWPSFSWTKLDWTTEGNLPLAQTAVVFSSSGSTRTEAATRTAANGSTAQISSQTYKNKVWGDAVTSRSAGTTDPEKTDYEYYENVAEAGRYAMLKQSVRAGEEWELYDYWSTTSAENDTGMLKFRYRPHNGSTLSALSEGEETYFEYTIDPFGRKTRPSLVRTTIDGVVVGRVETSYTDDTAATDNGMRLVSAVQLAQYAEAADIATASLQTTTRYYRENASYFRADGSQFYDSLLHSVTRPDGVKTVYAYQRGQWEDGVFLKNGAGGTEMPDALDRGERDASRSITIVGLSSEVTGSDELNSYDGYEIDPIHIVANKSTMSVEIRNSRALVVRTENRIWTGTDWSLVSFVDYEYADNGMLTSRKTSSDATYSATYSGDQKLSETDESGISLSYLYDAAGRVSSVTKAAGGTLTHALTTSFTYNANGQVLSETLSSSGTTEVIVNARRYDDAGRVDRITPAGLFPTTIAYDPFARTRTTTAPDGGIVIQTTQLDGRLASVTGSGTIARYYSYGVETDGRRWTKETHGELGSDRWQQAWVDWLGRPVLSQRPGFSRSSQPLIVEERFYDPIAGQLSQTTRTGYAPTCYKYNDWGELVRSGLDINGGGLDLVSLDRITDTETIFNYDAVAEIWWQEATTKTYPTEDSDTPLPLSFARVQLSGFSNGIQSRVEVTDVEGNLTTTVVTVDRATQTTTRSVTRIGVTGSETTLAVGGLEKSATGHDGLSTQVLYDSLGRLWKRLDTRSKPTEYAYRSGTSLVASVKDPAGSFTARFVYDDSGRVSSSRDAAGHYTYFSHNERGQLLRQWGGGAYPIEYGYDEVFGDRTTMSTFRAESGWNGASWPTSIAGTTDTTTWTFDEASGMMWKKTDAAGKSVEFDFNERGQVRSRKWARMLPIPGSTTRVTATYTYHDATGELLGQTYNDGTPAVAFTYTRMGQLDTASDHTGTWDYVYDEGKPWRQSAAVLPAFYGERTWTPQYEVTGLKGRYLGFNLGASAGSSSDLKQTYTYMGSGRLDTLTTGRAGVNTHDRTFDYGYETNAPWVASLAIGSSHQFTVTRTYDAERPLLASIDTRWGSDSQVKYAYGYNALRQRTHAQLSGEVFSDYYVDYASASEKAVTRYFAYNSRGELTSEVMHRKGASETPNSADELPGRREEFRYDAIGNRLTSGQTGAASTGDETYTPNNLNQYTQKENKTVRVTGTAATSASVVVQGAATTRKLERVWAADLAPANASSAAKGTVSVYSALRGAWTGTVDTYRHSSVDFFIPAAEQAFEYDEDGNLEHDSVWSYTYDAENRLVAMEHRSVLNTSGPLANTDMRRLEFRYDYKGRRVRKTVYGGWNGTSFDATPLSDTKFLFDGWNLIAEFSVGSGGAVTLARSFTWGLDLTGSLTASGGVGALLQIHDHVASKTLLPAYDGNGNVVALLNDSTGALEAIYEYSSFGQLVRSSGTYADANSFRFSTKFTDTETDLVYYGYRYYSTTLGRFINRDPIEENGGVNLYSFVRNRPIGRTDILGLNEADLYAEDPIVRPPWLDDSYGGDDGEESGRYNPWEDFANDDPFHWDDVPTTFISGAIDAAAAARTSDLLSGLARGVLIRSGSYQAGGITVSNSGNTVLLRIALDRMSGQWINMGPRLHGNDGAWLSYFGNKAPNSAGNGYVPAPAELIGTRDYYLFRDKNAPDSFKRGKGPNYYTEYGLKYYDAFQKLKQWAGSDRPALTSFVDKTAVALQVALEQALRDNPSVGANRQLLLEAAFNSHSDAYRQGGAGNLSVNDLIVVAWTARGGMWDYPGSSARQTWDSRDWIIQAVTEDFGDYMDKMGSDASMAGHIRKP
ncbi:MAG: RHS repeat-associated core domain-containing protein [Candidatus Didemnitutus sp.]|nr:RHS repeat-associated core domain-containing protein [Candidatus Didemnitutus sp.]